MKLSVVIPAYNEEKTIKKVISEVLRQDVYEIIVVDDGSKDKTSEVVKTIKNPKIKLFIQAVNQGKGAAIKTGISKVIGDYMIIQDADLEYDPEDFKKLIPLASENTIVYGSRIMGENKRAYNRTYFGNVLLTSFANILFGIKLTDSYTCYKLIPAKVAKSLNLQAKGFELEAEITAKLAKKGLKIIEVPISYNPRTYEQGKKIKAKDAILGLWTYLTIRLGK